MQELKEIRVNDNRLLLKDNLVKSAILPKISSELERDIVIQGNTIIEGAVYARHLEIEDGGVEIKGAVFAQLELHISSNAKNTITFCKAVGSGSSIVSYAAGSRLMFMADVNAKQVKLRNAFVAGSIFADEIILEDCVVIGGVFATVNAELNNCMVGTFNSPVVRASKTIYILLPSVFSGDKINALPGTEFINLSLADLGALYRGVPQAANSGKIRIDLETDELKTVLTDENSQQVMRSYSVAGKVLSADLLDVEKLQNHFLLVAASLGSQLLRTYDLGIGENGQPITLIPEKLTAFFFDILDGKIAVQEIQGNFSLQDMVEKFK